MSAKENSEKGLYDRIIKNTGVFGGVQWIVMLVTVVRTKIVARLLGTVGFGINESFNRTLNLVKSTTDLGVPFSSVRTISSCYGGDDDRLLKESVMVTRSWALLTALLGAVLCALLSPLFSRWAFDGDSGYTLSFILLSPVVAFSAVTGGEMAVLKGLRKLREIALSQLLSVILVLLVSVPIFYFFRLRGLVLSLVLVSFATMVITLMFSVRQVPYRVGMLDREVLGRGAEMVRLGVFFTIAAFLGSGAFSVVANFLMTHGGAEAVGAYSAGYALVTYLGVFVFSAMESDYFPRISTAIENRDDARVQLKQQIEISVLLMTPLITLFLLFLEPIVRLLLTEKFCTAVPMAQIAVLSLFFKAVSQPLAYISLAKGDSNVYLIQEACYDVALVALVIPCFNCGGLRMVGLAFTVAEIIGLLVNAVVARCRYDMKLSGDSVKLLLVLPWAVIVAFAAVSASSGWLRWTVGSVACIISMLVSYKGLKNRTSFIDSFRQKIREKLGK